MRCLALVSDAFGGRGGIAQYNRDLLAAFAKSGVMSSIVVLPRRASGAGVPPKGVRQLSPHPRRIPYVWSALRLAGLQRFDVVFCGHLFMAPLALVISRW